MITNQVATKKGKYFGLGFEIYDLGNEEIALSHGGWDKGVQNFFFILQKSKKGILIFTNVDDGYKVYEKLLLHYFGETGKKIIDIEDNSVLIKKDVVPVSRSNRPELMQRLNLL